jgi:hypothetical protein
MLIISYSMVSRGMPRTDDDAVHESLNPALKLFGGRHVPNGTAPSGEIRAATNQAINIISNLPEKCKKLGRDTATVQVGSEPHNPEGQRACRPRMRTP